ncbi:MAG: T9SS type A sorting domain-containing protein [Prevotellaceae bacterium]|jgi:hypothetical protein|nr:T9SS type A sorting domain-containing protein [Prevotellaceae bacterium]
MKRKITLVSAMWNMKNLKLIVLFCFLQAFFLSYSYSQAAGSQNVFPTSDAIWNIQRDDIVIDGVRVFEGSALYYGLSGDTIVGDKAYNKLYLLNDTVLNINSADRYVGGLRQEGKKVWFRPSPDFFTVSEEGSSPYPKETILYDFSKNAGDTIWHNGFGQVYWTMQDSVYASVITSIETDEQMRKIYHIQAYAHDNGEFSPGQTDSWIEGIGSIKGELWWFLSPLVPCICSDPYLACFKQGGEVKYLNDLCNSCFPVEAGVLESRTVPLYLTYNNNNIRVQGESAVFPCELKLFSLTGQLILETRLQSSAEQIPVNLLKGIWIYQVQKNRKVIQTGKLITK